MPSPAVLLTLVREMVTSDRSPRVPEPDLVMDGAEEVAAYTRAGREGGVMAPVYMFHTAHMCEIIKPGDTVIDLACGPANQLAQVARLNPDVRFVGVDLSLPMLDRAREHLKVLGLTNVELRHGDISELSSFTDASVDAVVSSMALHHLPTPALLEKTFSQVKRVLRSGGGIYMADFGHLRSEESIKYFANQYAELQGKHFTLDYLNSLKAAFSVGDFRNANAILGDSAKLYRTFGAPYMVVLKSATRRQVPGPLVKALIALREAMPDRHKPDYKDLKRFFTVSGLRMASRI